MPTVLQLESFVTVVDERGFTAASRRLGLSQPAVTAPSPCWRRSWACRCWFVAAAG